MRYLGQLALIFFLCLLGDIVAALLPFILPGSVIAMLLVLLLLFTPWLKEEHLGESADFMLRNMTFFFIPSGVLIIQYSTLINSIWWQLLVVNLVSLVICFGVTAWTVILTIRLQERYRARRSHG